LSEKKNIKYKGIPAKRSLRAVNSYVSRLNPANRKKVQKELLQFRSTKKGMKN